MTDWVKLAKRLEEENRKLREALEFDAAYFMVLRNQRGKVAKLEVNELLRLSEQAQATLEGTPVVRTPFKGGQEILDLEPEDDDEQG